MVSNIYEIAQRGKMTKKSKVLAQWVVVLSPDLAEWHRVSCV